MALGTQNGLLAGRYRQIETIGVGGMARVYLCEDERLGRRVAVKRMHADSPDEAAQRFDREAKLGASLNHPNLVSIFDIDTDGESVLIVMEYVPGTNLREAIDDGPPAPEESVAALKKVAAALDHVHAGGVVHRDVKPANILLRPDGEAKLADLGIATAAESTRITRSGMVLGTASYMAPEQLEGEKVGPAADVYSLAAVAFEALSGTKARTGETPFEVAHRVVNDPPPDLSDAWPAAPPAVTEAVAAGMARDPGERPRSAGELIEAIESGLAQTPPAPVLDAARFTSPPRSRRAWLPAVGVILLLAFVGGGALALLGGGGDDGAGKPTASRSKPEPKAKPQAKSKPKQTTPKAQSPAPATPVQQPDAQTQAPAQSKATGGSPAALNQRAFALMNQGRYDEAIPLLQRAVSGSSGGLTQAYALYNLGRSLRLAGRPREAIPILERRLRIPNQRGTVKRELDAARRAAR
jgi:eukaryotic-like serine/threonine-protein kinase